jgi:hypothetical protein
MDDRQEPLRISGLAVASLVLSVVPTGIGQILSLIFGIVALDQTGGEKPAAKGRGLATAGLIFTTMWLVAIPLTCVILWFTYPRSDQPDSQKAPTSAQGEPAQKPGKTATQAEGKAVKPGKPQQPGLSKHSVILKVETEPREDKYGFDISAAVQKKLKAAGIQVFTDEGKTADGVVVVQYSEREGGQYASFNGFGTPVGTGTVIVCKFSVLNSSTGEVVCELEISRGTPEQVESTLGLYTEAVKNFENSEDFQVIAYYVAAALGDKAAMPMIVPRLGDFKTRDTVLSIAEACGYEPPTPLEKAYIAVAKGNYAECEKLGSAAVTPLLTHLGVCGYADTSDVREIVRVLGQLRATQASAQVVAALRQSVQGFYTFRSEVEQANMIVLVINTLGDIGDQEALTEVKTLVDDERPEVAQAAKDASAKLAARLSTKPAGK